MEDAPHQANSMTSFISSTMKPITENKLTKQIFLSFMILVFMGTLNMITYRVNAQTTDDDWATPVKLSFTGGADDPHVVIDNENRVHVFWQDMHNGKPMYTRLENGQWLEPDVFEVPPWLTNQAAVEEGGADARVMQVFSMNAFHLISDSIGYLHAFWVRENGALLYSRGNSSRAEYMDAWTIPVILSPSSVGISVTTDDRGRIYLANIRVDALEGVYYRLGTPGGGNWSEAQLLYSSNYFRGLTAVNANIDIAIDDQDGVYVVWDDPFIERVFLARSDDRGSTWGEPQEMDRRTETDGLDAVGPSKTMLWAKGEYIWFLWQAGHDGNSCMQYFQISRDHGDTWSPRASLPESLVWCPKSLYILGEYQDRTLVLLYFENYVVLLGWDWDEGRWTDLQSQFSLAYGFVHPITYRQVLLDEQRPILGGDGMLYIVGSDTGMGEDIWFTSRLLPATQPDFSTPTSTPRLQDWLLPETITIDQINFSPPALIADTEGHLHAFWSRVGGNSIYYSSKLGKDEPWTHPITLINSPGGEAGSPVVALTPDGQLILAWADLNTGELYLSWAVARHAGSPDFWAQPHTLPIQSIGAREPVIKIDMQGVIYLAYTIPLNENRGVYLIISNGSFLKREESQNRIFGDAWSQPLVVFDAVDAGWSMVGQSRLIINNGESFHMMWTQYSLPPESNPLAVFYARSEDGMVWSEAEVVADGEIQSAQIIRAEGNLHRVWQNKGGGRVTFWHQYSIDQGLSWSQPERVTGLEDVDGTPSLIADSAEGLHIVQLANVSSAGNSESSLILQDWILVEVEKSGQPVWIEQESLKLEEIGNPDAIVSLALPDGYLVALLLADVIDEESEEKEFRILYTSRRVDLSANPSISLPTLTSVSEEVGIKDITPVPSPIPQAVLSTERDGGRSPLFGSRWAGIAVGGIPAVLLVIWTVVVGVRRLRKQ